MTIAIASRKGGTGKTHIDENSINPKLVTELTPTFRIPTGRIK